MYKYAIIEDDPHLFADAGERIEACNLPLDKSIGQRTTIYSWTEYIGMLANSPPDLIILDQMLKWADGLNKNAPDIINEFNMIYKGKKKPVLILTSRSYYEELVSQYISVKDVEDFHYTPDVNLFLVKTQIIIDPTSTLLKETLDKVILYLNTQRIVLPEIFKIIDLRFSKIDFIHYSDKKQRLNKIPFYQERFVAYLYTSRQHYGYLIFFDHQGTVQVYQLNLNNEAKSVKTYLETSIPSIVQVPKILYNPIFFYKGFLDTSFSEMVNDALINSGMFENDEFTHVLKRFGLLKSTPE